jgi:hypothetical protein
MVGMARRRALLTCPTTKPLPTVYKQPIYRQPLLHAQRHRQTHPKESVVHKLPLRTGVRPKFTGGCVSPNPPSAASISASSSSVMIIEWA